MAELKENQIMLPCTFIHLYWRNSLSSCSIAVSPYLRANKSMSTSAESKWRRWLQLRITLQAQVYVCSITKALIKKCIEVCVTYYRNVHLGWWKLILGHSWKPAIGFVFSFHFREIYILNVMFLFNNGSRNSKERA
jgi:hypothetical protein